MSPARSRSVLSERSSLRLREHEAPIPVPQRTTATTKSGTLTQCTQAKSASPAARKSFQAVRIAVNGELEGLYDCVTGLARRLKKGGRIAIITFHSLEDRIVKQAFAMLEADCVCPKTLPVCVCGKRKEIEIITKKPVTATVKEMAINTRSRSAKLRIAQKI